MTVADLAAEDRDPDTSTEDAWRTMLGRLNRLSVTRHFDAYADIDWDSDELALDPTDPRFELSSDEPLANTDWYRSQPADVRARLGCELLAGRMKTGLTFENVLKRGLLNFAMALPNGAPEFRYAYHEVIEEAQHSLMFQEFVNRSGFDANGLGLVLTLTTRWIVSLGRTFPELFFLFVLGGEDPVDHVQRRDLRSEEPLHPLVERIMRIHVTEEARHLSFARHYLRRSVPTLGRFHRVQLAWWTPTILKVMAGLMLKPPAQLVKRYHIPRKVIREAYNRNPAHRRHTAASLTKVHDLCAELGLTHGIYNLKWCAYHLAAA